MATQGKVPRVAGIMALFLAGAAVISAITGRILILPFALIPLFAGIGILRGKVWSAYGLALYCFAQAGLVLLMLSRDGAPEAIQWAPSAGLSLMLGALFLAAGRKLASDGGTRGRPWPWIGITVLSAVPLLFVQAFVIPSGAMEKTLLVGDKVLVRRFPKPDVSRDALVVFRYPVDRRQIFVKRIVGVPGDHIKLVDKVLYRNGVAVNETYAVHSSQYPDVYRDNFPNGPEPQFVPKSEDMLKHVAGGELIVPPGCYFVLGDNRDNSLDSRYWGFVPASDVVGKPLLIYDSSDASSGKTRWSRVFRTL